VPAGTREDNGREVSGEIVGVTALVAQGKGEGDLERELGSASDFAVSPRLTENGDLTARSDCVQERFSTSRVGAVQRFWYG
jgi:hypothetical protein